MVILSKTLGYTHEQMVSWRIKVFLVYTTKATLFEHLQARSSTTRFGKWYFATSGSCYFLDLIQI